jgi:putative transposase
MFRWRLLVEDGRKTGHTFSQSDLIIATTAIHHGLTLVSRDTREYQRARTPIVNPWTDVYRREGDGYPSDLRDAEWARLRPLIPEASPGGRPRKTDDMRAAMNAILYLLRTGCRWRYLPPDAFPPRSTVYNIFRKFQRDGVWEAIWAELHMALREQLGREASPSAAVLDSQSVKSAEKGVVRIPRWVTTPASR